MLHEIVLRLTFYLIVYRYFSKKVMYICKVVGALEKCKLFQVGNAGILKSPTFINNIHRGHLLVTMC